MERPTSQGMEERLQPTAGDELRPLFHQHTENRVLPPTARVSLEADPLSVKPSDETVAWPTP